MVWCVVLVCAVAAVTDLAWRRVPNWLTYPGLLVGLVGNSASGLVPEAWRDGLDLIGWEASLQGLFVCGGIMLVCFVLFEIGGGDVKLLAMIGACLGWERGLEILLWTFVLGAMAGISILVWNVGALTLLRKLAIYLLASFRLVQWQPLTEADRALLRPSLFLAPMAGLAVLIVVWGWL